MKKYICYTLLLFSILVLSSCLSKNTGQEEEIIYSANEEEGYLDRETSGESISDGTHSGGAESIENISEDNPFNL